MTGLLVIDIQNFYENSLVDFEKTCTNAGKVIDKFRKNKLPVFHIRHIKKVPVINKIIPLEKMREFQIHDNVKPLEGELIIDKYFINCFRETTLLEKLKEKKVKNLVICGMMTHMCVDAAVRASNDYGFNVTVIDDACTTKDLKYRDQVIKAMDVHNTMLAAFEYGYAKVISTEEFLKK